MTDFNVNAIKSFMSLFKKNAYEAPTSAVIKTCSLCVEPGASKRPCCNALFCDHCYVKNTRCPNCDVYTKQEKLTGATFQVKVFSEHEECRVCLEPGLKRRCCSNYYCDTCYYKLTTCRSCGLPVGHKAEERHKMGTAECLTVLLGWMITVFFVVVFTVFFLVVIVAEVQTPVGVFGYRCHGFFRKCAFHVCVDMDYSVASAETLPPLSDWAKCTLESEAKVESLACIYDHQLYDQSDKLMGYDICSSEYNNGVYIFEDTFEYWANQSYHSNAMKSAKWGQVVNAFSSNFCGAGRNFGYNRSMSFQGSKERYAETVEMDVSSGGRFEMEMFFPPIGYDAFSEHCKAGYIGTVYVEWATPGSNYTVLASYDPRLDRQNNFFPVQLEIPDEAKTNATRFRISQPIFVEANDHFAVDNVRVLKYLPPKWTASSAFAHSMQKAREIIQKAQCCVDTDWCAQRQSLKQSNHCPIDFPLWYKGKHYLIRLTEVMICAALAMLILKLIYNTVSEYLIYGRIPLQDELLELFQIKTVKEWMKAHVPLKYRYKLIQFLESTNDRIGKIHSSARLEENLRHEFNDEEGKGELVKRKSVLEAEEKALKKKIKKLKKRLDARMKQKNFKVSPAIDQEDTAYDTYMRKVNAAARGEETEDDVPTGAVTAFGGTSEKGAGGSGMFFEGGDSKFDDIKAITDDDLMPENKEVLMSDLDRVRRSNFSMLRIPFYHDVDDTLRRRFLYGTLISFGIVFIALFAVSTNYTIHEPVQVFGMFSTDFQLDSVLIILFATACDFHSIFHVMKHNIPVRPQWLPMVTIDLSEEVRCLFIGHHTIPIEDILELQAFPKEYAYCCFIGYLLGVFPWCMLSLLLRQATLNYDSMRVVTPFLGSIMIIRAILGPSFVIKCYYCLEYLLTTHFSVRELMGQALQSTNTINTIYNTTMVFVLVCVFLCGLFAYQQLPLVFGCALVFGAIYGGFTGCIHALPIKPWMCLTTLRGGVWMTLKKRQMCPCIYWGKYCTDMHNYEERFVLFTTDDIKFVSLINGGINGVNA